MSKISEIIAMFQDESFTYSEVVELRNAINMIPIRVSFGELMEYRMGGMNSNQDGVRYRVVMTTAPEPTQKISSIKAIRDVTKDILGDCMGLKEAKDGVESVIGSNYFTIIGSCSYDEAQMARNRLRPFADIQIWNV